MGGDHLSRFIISNVTFDLPSITSLGSFSIPVSLSDDEIRKSFEGLNNLDLACLIADKVDVKQEIMELIGAHRHYCLTHAALAALPVNEIVTTNYDCLFDVASEEQNPRIIPYSLESD